MDYKTMLLLMLTFVIPTIIFIISTLLLNNNTPKSLRLPPKPPLIPIIKNFLEHGKYPHRVLTKLSKIYGPIMTLKFDTKRVIVISSPQVAKQVLLENGQFFSNRVMAHASQALDHHKFSIVWMPPTNQWRDLRKICATQIFSPQKLDSTQIIRHKKVQDLLDHVNGKSMKVEVFDIGEVAFTTVLNSISNTLFSMDLSHFIISNNNNNNNNDDDEKSQEFKEIIECIMRVGGRLNVPDLFPSLRKLDPQRIHSRISNYFKRVLEILDGIIEERMNLRASKYDSKECNDVLDSFLKIVEEDNSQFNRHRISHLFLDLFVAGKDSTSSTIEWIMAELLHNPNKLAKARNELHKVIGKDGTIEESHITKLPFLRAVVKEALRLHPPNPLLLPHKSDEMVELCDFIVPKNALVMVNVWVIGRDPSIWENPNEFVPERFLGCEVDFKGRDFGLIPFGAGKKICHI